MKSMSVKRFRLGAAIVSLLVSAPALAQSANNPSTFAKVVRSLQHLVGGGSSQSLGVGSGAGIIGTNLTANAKSTPVDAGSNLQSSQPSVSTGVAPSNAAAAILAGGITGAGSVLSPSKTSIGAAATRLTYPASAAQTQTVPTTQANVVGTQVGNANGGNQTQGQAQALGSNGNQLNVGLQAQRAAQANVAANVAVQPNTAVPIVISR